MSSFTSELDVRITQKKRDGRALAELLTAFTYEVGDLGSGDVITVPQGYVTDFASCPACCGRSSRRWATPARPPCCTTGSTRPASAPRRGDRIFLEAMAVLEARTLDSAASSSAPCALGRARYRQRREVSARLPKTPGTRRARATHVYYFTAAHEVYALFMLSIYLLCIL
jgi:hypothetical protein